MTKESLITRPEGMGVEKPESHVDGSDQNVETGTDTHQGSEADTSSQGKNVDWEKRYKDLQSFQSRREADMKKQIAELERSEGFKAPTTPEEMERFKQEHADLYNVMLTVAHQTSEETAQGKVTQLQEQERAMKEAQAAIMAAHPDYKEVVANNKFHEWATAQPFAVQQWIYENPDNAELAIIALDRYKAFVATQPQEVTKEDPTSVGSAADAVRVSSTVEPKSGEKIWTAREIKSMSSADWAKHEADIEKAYTEGRVRM